MHSRDDRGVQPFGRRRPPDGSTGPGGLRTSDLVRSDVPGSDVPGSDLGSVGRAARPLAWALRVSAGVGLLAVVATMQLARLSGSDETPVRVTLNAAAVPADPDTTGAILPAGAARATRLNPCLVPAADHLRP